jgi:hypothetical protein
MAVGEKFVPRTLAPMLEFGSRVLDRSALASENRLREGYNRAKSRANGVQCTTDHAIMRINETCNIYGTDAAFKGDLQFLVLGITRAFELDGAPKESTKITAQWIPEKQEMRMSVDVDGVSFLSLAADRKKMATYGGIIGGGDVRDYTPKNLANEIITVLENVLKATGKMSQE